MQCPSKRKHCENWILLWKRKMHAYWDSCRSRRICGVSSSVIRVWRTPSKDSQQRLQDPPFLTTKSMVNVQMTHDMPLHANKRFPKDVSNLSHAVSNTAVKTHIRSSPYARQRTNILPSTDSSIIPFADSTRNPPAASPSEAPSPYPDEQPRTAKETYDPYKRRKRRKMREDSEEGTPRNVKEPSSTMKTAKGGKGKRSNERRRTSNKVLSLEAFNCDNIDRSKKIKAPRLTVGLSLSKAQLSSN